MKYRNLHGRAYVVLIALIALAAVLAACRSTTKNSTVQSSAPGVSVAANATTTAGAVILVVTANDFSFALNRTTVPAGRAQVQLINQSTYNQHEVWVYPQNQPRLQEMLAAKRTGQQIDEQDYLPGLAGHVEDIAPGKTATFAVTLPPGTYELACFILSSMGGQMMPPGTTGMAQMEHYDLGMHTLLTVQ